MVGGGGCMGALHPPTLRPASGAGEALTAFRALMNSSLEILWFLPCSTL